jgi:hypothetical protein
MGPTWNNRILQIYRRNRFIFLTNLEYELEDQVGASVGKARVQKSHASVYLGNQVEGLSK